MRGGDLSGEEAEGEGEEGWEVVGEHCGIIGYLGNEQSDLRPGTMFGKKRVESAGMILGDGVRGTERESRAACSYYYSVYERPEPPIYLPQQQSKAKNMPPPLSWPPEPLAKS